MELLAIGASNATSDPFVVNVGQMPTISLKDAAGPVAGREQDYGVGNNAHVYLQIQSGDHFFTVATLDAGGVDARGVSKAVGVIAGSGTFRVFRPAGPLPVGVELT